MSRAGTRLGRLLVVYLHYTVGSPLGCVSGIAIALTTHRDARLPAKQRIRRNTIIMQQKIQLGSTRQS